MNRVNNLLYPIQLRLYKNRKDSIDWKINRYLDQGNKNGYPKNPFNISLSLLGKFPVKLNKRLRNFNPKFELKAYYVKNR